MSTHAVSLSPKEQYYARLVTDKVDRRVKAKIELEVRSLRQETQENIFTQALLLIEGMVDAPGSRALDYTRFSIPIELLDAPDGTVDQTLRLITKRVGEAARADILRCLKTLPRNRQQAVVDQVLQRKTQAGLAAEIQPYTRGDAIAWIRRLPFAKEQEIVDHLLGCVSARAPQNGSNGA